MPVPPEHLIHYLHQFCVCIIQDITNSAIFALGFFAGGVANAVYASDNADNYDEIENFCDLNNLPQETEDFCDDLRTVRDSEGAAAVS